MDKYITRFYWNHIKSSTHQELSRVFLGMHCPSYPFVHSFNITILAFLIKIIFGIYIVPIIMLIVGYYLLRAGTYRYSTYRACKKYEIRVQTEEDPEWNDEDRVFVLNEIIKTQTKSLSTASKITILFALLYVIMIIILCLV